MGFDNECIVNIQTLAGEYFCPVCRLLVYPSEALQSQCTHLYCKPCLAYVVGTTRACPYDGYLVTEPDSKPLLESNKALADTIGRIGVRCLYHRSGCQWQGPLSDCTSHCSGCVFGNSAVVCNRCAVQIVHRQVQEHAQTCSGVQPQVAHADSTQNLAATATSAPANSGQPQTATLTVAINSVAPIPATVQDPNIQTGLNPQPQANGVSIGAGPNPEQLYQQQYYQQYPGYDPYQQAYQNYYPYPQQPQVYLQPQQVLQQPIQSQTSVQTQVPLQPQGQAQPQPIQNVNPQYQTPVQMIPQAQPQSQGYPYPYPQPQPSQTHPQPQQMPQFPQAQPQIQQSYPQMPTQPHPQAPQQLQQTQPQVQQQSTQALTGHHSYPQPQQMQMGTQQRPNVHSQSGPTLHLPPHPHGQYPPQSHSQVPIHQFPPQNQVPGAPPTQQQPPNLYAQQQPPNLYAQQPGHPPMQKMPQPQASSGQVSGPVQNQLRPHGQLPPPPSLQAQLYQQPQNYSARPVMQNHEVQSQASQQSLSGYPGQPQARPPYIGLNQQYPNQNHQVRSGNQVQINEPPSQRTAGKETNGDRNESVDSFKLRENEGAKETGSELHSEENKPFETSAAEQKNVSDLSQKGENLTLGDKSEEGHTSADNKSGQLHGQVHLSIQYPPTHQQRPPTLQPSFPSVPPHHPQVPGQPLNMLRPQGPGQPFNQHPDHIQHGRPPSQFVPHERNFELQHSGDPRMPLGNTSGLLNSSGGFMGRPPFYGAEGQFGQQRPIGPAGSEFLQDPRPRYLGGQSPGQLQGRNMKEVMGTDERFNPSMDRVPRTLEKEPFGLESGALAANRFLPPYEAGRGNFGHARPDFSRSAQGFGPNHFDRYPSRSPGRENAGFLPRDFGDFPRIRPGMRNFEGQSRPFDGGRRPFGQFQRGELEGPGFQGPRSLPGHLRLGENFPPYRPLNSSYPPPGSLDPFDNARKRLPPNSGWCRICKVDCEGVEGLEMHSQTREHQDMAMDMVRSIKLQNSKKQKMSKDRSSLEDPSKKRGAGYEIHGDKL